MIVRRVEIQHFRGISEADLQLSKHVLLVGTNNVGKSTVLEALDLALGPERLGRQNPIQEHDFYDGKYLTAEGEPVPIRIDVTLSDVDDEAQRAFRNHLEWWDSVTKKLLTSDEAAKANLGDSRYTRALRVSFRAQYDKDEDEFTAATFFSHPPVEEGIEPEQFGRKEKRICGFLYLRSLRTGSRALSLEKGTLLDTILQLKDVQAGGLWESILEDLRKVAPKLGGDHGELRKVLDSIESHVSRYIPLSSKGNATDLQVTELTREHLRRSIVFFLKSEPSTTGVPFQHSGTGTLNVLVLALLSFIAELKKSVIFAMEEPETALPPYTQRRIAKLAQANSTQCILTSHSPYIAECFLPENLLVLRRGASHELAVAPMPTDVGIKRKTLQRDFRLRFAEGVLSRGILAVEGISELWALPVASEILAASDANYSHLDLSGIAVIERSGDGGLVALGEFFRGLGLRTFAFYDLPNDLTLRDRLAKAFDHCTENPKSGIEKLLAQELPLARIEAFLKAFAGRLDFPQHITPPATGATEAAVREYAFGVLKSRKGDAYSAELLRSCTAAELPTCITALLKHISQAIATPQKDDSSAKGT